MTGDKRLKSLLGEIARAEHLHLWKLASLMPAAHVPAEAVLIGEIAILCGYSMCMASEQNDTVKSAFQYIFADHQFHAEYLAGQVQSLGCDPGTLTGGGDLSGGRPIEKQFMKPEDTIWKGNFGGSYNKRNVDAQTLVNVDMSLAGETAAWDSYLSAAKFETNDEIKTHFAGFSSVEDQHVSIIGSLKDTTETPLERALVHEQVEVQSYQMLIDCETNSQVKKVFQELYREDLEQARLFGQLAS
jgi:rubrerythrin